TNPAGSRATGPRAAGTSNLCAVLLLIGITATSLLIHVTDWPWWAIFVLVGMPFLTASVWCEVRAVKRSAAEDTDCRGRSTGRGHRDRSRHLAYGACAAYRRRRRLRGAPMSRT